MNNSKLSAQRGQEALKLARSERANGLRPPIPTKADLRAAIRAKCYECMGGEDAPGVRTDIANCSSGPTSQASCSLWAHRPHQSRMAGAGQKLASEI